MRPARGCRAAKPQAARRLRRGVLAWRHDRQIRFGPRQRGQVSSAASTVCALQVAAFASSHDCQDVDRRKPVLDRHSQERCRSRRGQHEGQSSKPSLGPKGLGLRRQRRGGRKVGPAQTGRAAVPASRNVEAHACPGTARGRPRALRTSTACTGPDGSHRAFRGGQGDPGRPGPPVRPPRPLREPT